MSTNLAVFLDIVRSDTERLGGDFESTIGEEGLTVTAHLDDGTFNYVVDDHSVLEKQIYDEADEPKKQEQLIDAFWRVMNDNYLA